MGIKLFFTRISFPFALIVTKIKDACYKPKPNYVALKNKHEGQRCFIVCTGPSLTLEDLNKLKGEYCFSMNSIFKSYDKTDWRPNYYGISDYRFYNLFKDKIDEPETLKNTTLIYSAYEVKYRNKNNPKAVPVYCSNTRRAISLMKDLTHKHIGLSKHLDRYVNNGSTVAFIMIQMAIYMGFKDIYLLGSDCTYLGKDHSDLTPNDKKQKVGRNDGIKFINVYSSIVNELPEGVHIYNATRGGMLEVFPRVDLDEVLKSKK